MKISSSIMPQSVRKVVVDATKIVNLTLILGLIGHGIIFWLYDAYVLFYFNCICAINLIFAHSLFKKKQVWPYIVIVVLGIFIFMLLTVVCLGWEYGFQQYCIGFVASLVFLDFYMSKKRKISRTTLILVAFIVFIYVALRIWTYEHPCIYKIDNEILMEFFYIFNSLLGFAFLIMYLCIYSITVHRLENSLTEMANVDSLTGISNRRKMQQLLKIALEEYETPQYQTVIAMLDIDFFKKINDTYGHDVGDEVLTELAKILRDKHDANEDFHVSRWGGEEFLIFYERHQKNKEDIIKEFDMLRQQIQDTVISYNNFNINITATIGLAFYEKGATIQSLLKQADENLYLGKESGRNKVVS